jgi:hypothetical protein
MARGISIGDVTNTLDTFNGEEKIPVSSGETDPQVVTTGKLKEYINDDAEIPIDVLARILT